MYKFSRTGILLHDEHTERNLRNQNRLSGKVVTKLAWLLVSEVARNLEVVICCCVCSEKRR